MTREDRELIEKFIAFVRLIALHQPERKLRNDAIAAIERLLGEHPQYELTDQPMTESVSSEDCESTCLDCGTIGLHHCEGVPGGFDDDEPNK